MAEIIREYSPRNFILGKSFTSSKLKDMPARSRCYKQFQYMLNDRKTDSEISKTVASRSRGRVKKKKYVAVPVAIKSRRAILNNCLII